MAEGWGQYEDIEVKRAAAERSAASSSSAAAGGKLHNKSDSNSSDSKSDVKKAKDEEAENGNDDSNQQEKKQMARPQTDGADAATAAAAVVVVGKDERKTCSDSAASETQQVNNDNDKQQHEMLLGNDDAEEKTQKEKTQVSGDDEHNDMDSYSSSFATERCYPGEDTEERTASRVTGAVNGNQEEEVDEDQEKEISVEDFFREVEAESGDDVIVEGLPIPQPRIRGLSHDSNEHAAPYDNKGDSSSDDNRSKASDNASVATTFSHILSQAQLGPVIPTDSLLRGPVNRIDVRPSPSCPNFGSLEAAHKRVYDSGLTFSEAKGQLWNLRKTGYLMKRGFRYRKLWNRRYIVLSGRMLKYFDRPPRDDVAASVPRGKLELTKHTIVQASKDPEDGPFAFHVLSLEAQIRLRMVSDPQKAKAVVAAAEQRKEGDAKRAAAEASASSNAGSSSSHGWGFGSWFGGDDLDSSAHREKNRNSASTWRFQATSEKERRSWMTAIQRAINLIRRVEVAPTLSGVGSVHYHYQMGDKIGTGRFGDVYNAVATMTGREYAIKVVDKEKRVKTKEAALLLRSEIKAMRRVTRELDHSNICKLFQAYEDPYMVYLVLEKLDGGDLFEHIAECVAAEDYTEAYVAGLIKQIAGALQELHSACVVLCDLRPENLLFTDATSNTVKVIEFGRALVLGGNGRSMGARSGSDESNASKAIRQPSSGGYVQADRHVSDDSIHSTGAAVGGAGANLRNNGDNSSTSNGAAATYTQGMVNKNNGPASSKREAAKKAALRRLPLSGMSPYLSPEIISFGKPNRSADIWALGCILFALLVGHPPFGGKSHAELFKSISGGLQAENLNIQDWGRVSGPAKVLLGSMLQLDPSKRITAAQILQHEWIKNPSDNVLGETHERIKSFQEQRKAVPTHRPRLRSKTPDNASVRGHASMEFTSTSAASSTASFASAYSGRPATAISSIPANSNNNRNNSNLSPTNRPGKLRPQQSAEILALDVRAEKVREHFGVPRKAQIRSPGAFENSQANFAPPGRFLNDLEGQMRLVREMEEQRLRVSNPHYDHASRGA